MTQSEINAHLEKIEELANAYASRDGSEICIAGAMGVPVRLAHDDLAIMRKSFIFGALAASCLLIEGDPEIPEGWLKRNRVEIP